METPPCRLLIIEDHAPTVLLLSEIFQESQDPVYAVRSAGSLSEGLHALSGGNMDIVLLDLLLPDAKDFEALLRIHRDFPDIPIVVLTVFEDETLTDQAIRHGACDYILKKNLEPRTLQRAVRYALDRKRAFVELKTREAEIRTLIDLIPDLLLQIRRDGVILNVSGTPGQLLLESFRRCIGEKLLAVLPEISTSHFLEHMETALHSGQRQIFECRIEQDRSIRQYEVRISANGPEDALAIVRDITERKRNEEQIQKLLWRISDDYEKLRKLDQLKDSFLAIVSHELRTPLTSILGYLRLVQGGAAGPVNETQTRFLETIDNNAKRLYTLVNDLLDLTSLESGSLSMKYAPTPVQTLMETSLTALRASSDAKGIRLGYGNRCGEETVEIDRVQMGRVVTNLLSNAVKFTAQGGEIEVGTDWLEDPDRRSLHLWVKDNGVGIPEKHLDHVFDKFYQVDDAITRKAGGTGLGLSICKKIVEAHQGRIWAESLPDRGTTFHVVVPSRPLTPPLPF